MNKFKDILSKSLTENMRSRIWDLKDSIDDKLISSICDRIKTNFRAIIAVILRHNLRDNLLNSIMYELWVNNKTSDKRGTR